MFHENKIESCFEVKDYNFVTPIPQAVLRDGFHLNPKDIAVYCVIFTFYTKQMNMKVTEGIIFPSLDTIASMAGMSVDNKKIISRIIKKLETLGLIRVLRDSNKGQGGRNKKNRYILMKVPDCIKIGAKFSMAFPLATEEQKQEMRERLENEGYYNLERGKPMIFQVEAQGSQDKPQNGTISQRRKDGLLKYTMKLGTDSILGPDEIEILIKEGYFDNLESIINSKEKPKWIKSYYTKSYLKGICSFIKYYQRAPTKQESEGIDKVTSEISPATVVSAIKEMGEKEVPFTSEELYGRSKFKEMKKTEFGIEMNKKIKQKAQESMSTYHDRKRHFN